MSNNLLNLSVDLSKYVINYMQQLIYSIYIGIIMLLVKFIRNNFYIERIQRSQLVRRDSRVASVLAQT